MDPEPTPFLTVSEAARLLSVSDRTIRRLCADGSLPHTLVGSQVRILRTGIDDYVERAAASS